MVDLQNSEVFNEQIESVLLPKLNFFSGLDRGRFLPCQLNLFPFVAGTVRYSFTLEYDQVGRLREEIDRSKCPTVGHWTIFMPSGISRKVPMGSLPFIRRACMNTPLIGSFD